MEGRDAASDGRRLSDIAMYASLFMINEFDAAR